MAIRYCTDRSGTEWEVFEVFPAADRAGHARVPSSFQSGWLCFQSLYERRRLAPIPIGWQSWDDRALVHALSQCDGVRRRTPPAFDAAPRQRGGETEAQH